MKNPYMPFILAVIYLVHFNFASSAQNDNQDAPYYELILALQPEKNLLKNNMTMIIDSSQLIDRKLKLTISDAAKIHIIEGKGIINKQISSIDNILKIILLTFEKPTAPTLTIKMEYELEISDTLKNNRISKEWIELSRSSYWYPSFGEVTPFKYSMQLGLDNSYQVITGDYSLQSEDAMDYFLMVSRIPRRDIAFSAAKDLYSAEGVFTVVSSSTAKIKLKDVISCSDSSLQFLAEYIGKPDDFNHKRQIIFGALQDTIYGVRNYILLNLNAVNNFSQKDLSRLLVYEYALYWFASSNPDSKHAWLSESFAEYLSLIFLRENYGNPAFEQAIDEKKNEILKDTAIMLAYEGRPNYEALHHKGPFILYQLEHYIGKKQFRKLLNRMIDLDIDTNEKLYNLISTEFDNGALDELYRLMATI